MKKFTVLFTLFLLSASFLKAFGQVYYSGCSANQLLLSTAINNQTQALGANSFAAGYKSIAAGGNSISLGQNCYSSSQSFSIGQNAEASASQSLAIGRYVSTSGLGSGSIVIGSCTSSGPFLDNSVQNSLMIGFNSNTPVFFANSTQIGISTKSPRANFDVNGTSIFSEEVVMESLKTDKGKRVVVTDENGLLSFTDDFLEIPGDNLGNHIAEANLNIGNFSIFNGSNSMESSKLGFFLTAENNAVLYNGKETSFNILSGSMNKSSIWLANETSGGFGLISNADNKSGGIFYDVSSPKAIINFTSDKVGIGITPIETSNYKLFVTGGILTEEVLVKLQSEWADYVFEPDYQLQDLNEVEQYITVNKHLEGVPSQADVKENGVKLGEMDSILLEKIEQLTLYIIQQQKEIDQLKSSLND